MVILFTEKKISALFKRNHPTSQFEQASCSTACYQFIRITILGKVYGNF
jgi:hypothetical protein